MSLNSTGNPDQNTGANTEELEQQVVDLREQLHEAKAEAKRLKAQNKITDPKVLKNLKVPVA